MEQLKRKEIKQDELVCSFMNTETGEVAYSLREEIVLELIHESKKNIEPIISILRRIILLLRYIRTLSAYLLMKI